MTPDEIAPLMERVQEIADQGGARATSFPLPRGEGQGEGRYVIFFRGAPLTRPASGPASPRGRGGAAARWRAAAHFFTRSIAGNARCRRGGMSACAGRLRS